MKDVVQKVNPGESFADLAHRLTGNEFVADETVKITVQITF